MPAFVFPLIAVIADATYLTIAKSFLKRYGRLTSNEFNWLQFAGLALVLGLAIPFFGEFPGSEAIVRTWPLVLLVIVLATAANILFFWGLEREKVSQVEPFLLFNPITAILIVSLFYSDERIWQVYVAAGIAALVLGWTHIKRSHLALAPGLLAVLGYMAIYGLETATVKTLLHTYTPITLYFIRCLGVWLGLSLVARPNWQIIKPHHLAFFGLLAGIAVVSVVSAYTAFSLRGISETMIIFILSPVLVYIFSIVWLKDRWYWKNLVASLVITGLVVWISLVK